MKAGTAQRVTLNVFSSLVMVLLGRVYDGLMVDLQAANQKLVRRSESILERLTGRSGAQARAALRRANGNVKLAVLLLHGCELEEGKSVLDRAGGQLRAALAAIGKPPPDAADSRRPHPRGRAGDVIRVPLRFAHAGSSCVAGRNGDACRSSSGKVSGPSRRAG